VRAERERPAPPLARTRPTAAQLAPAAELHLSVLATGALANLLRGVPLCLCLWLGPPASSSQPSARPRRDATRPGYQGPATKGSLQLAEEEPQGGPPTCVVDQGVGRGTAPHAGRGVRVKGGKEVRHVKPPSTPRARGLARQVATRTRTA
jgi:hypothetical protein